MTKIEHLEIVLVEFENLAYYAEPFSDTSKMVQDRLDELREELAVEKERIKE